MTETNKTKREEKDKMAQRMGINENVLGAALTIFSMGVSSLFILLIREILRWPYEPFFLYIGIMLICLGVTIIFLAWGEKEE